MVYKNIIKGQFVKRKNRFVADVVINGKQEEVHIKNTGRLTELLQKDAEVLLTQTDNPNRKTKFSLIAINSRGKWVNIDSEAPNKIAYEALQAGKITEFGAVAFVKKEVTYGNSRFDLFYERDNDKGFIEVKGVTLHKDGIAMFPDAPTKRGTKHVRHLIDAVQAGYKGAVLFIVQMEDCRYFTPNWEMDAAFANALVEASKQGVEIIAYDSIVTETGLMLNKPLPVLLETN